MMQKFVGKFKICFHGFQVHRPLHFSTAASTTSSTSLDSFANYLVNSLGFTHKQALSTSAKLTHCKRNVTESNAISVVNFLKNHDFDDTHIRKIVSFDPRLLSYNTQKTLEPKFQWFKDQGFSGSDIISVVSRIPKILSLGLESNILPAIQILRQVLDCDDQVIALVKKLHSVCIGGIVIYLKPNVDLLESYGIPIELIRAHLMRQPRVFLRNPEVFKDMLVKIEQKLGISRDSPMFLYGLGVAARSEENFESKCQILKSFGWTDSEVNKFVMKNPSCFSFSEASFKKKLDFLMKELQLKPAYLTSCNGLFTCSLEKRIVPRHKVLLLLREKGLLKENPSLSYTVSFTEACFLKRFVLPFKEVHEVYAEHTGRSVSMMTQERADNL